MPRRSDMPPLRRADLDPDPIAQFRDWFAVAEREVPLPEAITLATVDEDGPDARMVLLKGANADGFRFFSNYESAKAAQLAGSPAAALIAYWRELDRQVRARGEVERLAEAESDAYFATRPRERRIGAWASRQGSVLPSREALDERVRELSEQFGEGEIPRPEWWGGYLLRPDVIELWERGEERLHDRVHFGRRPDGSWEALLLAP